MEAPLTSRHSEPELSAAAKVQRRRRRRLITFTVFLLLIGGGGAAYYYYLSGIPGRAADEFRKGAILMSPGHYQEAIEQFNKALKLTPDMNDVYLQRGLAYMNLGQIDKAMGDFERTLAANPKQAEVYTARGTIYRQRKETRRAIEEFTKALDLRDDADIYYERAQAFESLGEYEKAIADLDKVVAALRDAPHVLRARALIKRSAGDQAGYEADLAEAIAYERRHVKNARK